MYRIKLLRNNMLWAFLIALTATMNVSCQVKNSTTDDIEDLSEATLGDKSGESLVEERKYRLPNIDLSHWKVTLPVGKPDEVEPPEILNYATNAELKNYMYNDSTDGSLVFYAFPNSTTTNTKYSRCELREQMVPGDNNVNWTFPQGGTMKGTLAMDEVTKDPEGKYHKVIIMQIHGRLTNAQKELIGAKDNNAPPVLKIYWDKGYVRVKTKELKDKSASDTDILHTDAWGDDEGYTFPDYVGFKKFTLEVKVKEGKLTVVMNNRDYKTYDNVSIRRWKVFENYFKAGNYFQSKEKYSYAKVKYYDLEVSH
ncbi:polysaccharide lyase family 7 protein [Flavobacteriaceae bacterium F89]|uniref:Polysaccharide lyase family 7 protein n=1 Tax=Cerina litoralis TaxID=2874477 RepID=A0AAE3JUH6_9FLAO|nr:polysaccharide lyase family 7 protein [Cerina litoralis]MCG2462407.1 polysaccharide lyase family 7 protein [Cerina litoralis]